MSLSSLIVQREIATIREVEEALARQVLYGGDLITNLLEVVVVDEAVLANVLAESFGMQPAPKGELPLPPGDVKKWVPKDLALRHSILPMAADKTGIVVAVSEPLSTDVEQELSFALSLPVAQRIAPMFRIREAIAKEYEIPLERRYQRLLARLVGKDLPTPNSLPPLLGQPPDFAAPPRPPSEAPRIGSVEKMPAVRLGEIGAPNDVPYDRPRSAPPPGQKTPTGMPRMVEPAPVVMDVPQAPPMPSNMGEAPAPNAPRAHATAPLSRPPTSTGPRSPRATSDLPPVSFRRASATPPRPARRRRGPLSLDAALDEMDETNDRDAVLDLFFEFAKQFFEYTAFFLVRGESADGRDAFGSGLGRDRVATLTIPLEVPSMIAAVRDKRMPTLLLPTTRIDVAVLGELMIEARTPLLIFPLIVRKKSVALLLCDGGEAGIDPMVTNDLGKLATATASAFERLIVRRKLAAAGAGAPNPNAPDAPLGRLESTTSLELPAYSPGATGTTANASEAALAAAAVMNTVNEPIAPEIVAVVASAPGQLFAPFPTGLPAREPDAPRTEQAPFVRAPFPKPPSAAPAPNEPFEPPPMRRELASDPFELVPRSIPFDRVPSEPPPFMPKPESVPPVVSSPSRAPIAPNAPSPSSEESSQVISQQPNTLPDPKPPEMPEIPGVPYEDPQAIHIHVNMSSLAGENEEPPPATAVQVRRPSGPPIPREEPNRDWRQSASWDDYVPPSSDQRSVPARRPPAPSPTLPPLPSVIVDSSLDYRELVDQYLHGDSNAGMTLLRAGQHAMSAIMERFPGPISVERNRFLQPNPPRAQDAGPLMRLIAGQRRVAFSFVIRRVEDPDPERRMWAVLLISELPYPEAIKPIVLRLFDPDPHVRAAARIAGRAIAEHHAASIIERIATIASSVDEPMQRRVAALDALGELREPLAGTLLVNALADPTPEIASAARVALRLLTRHDLGADARKWFQFWQVNGARMRVEWLIDAVGGDDHDLAASAFDELYALTRQSFGFRPDMLKREREKVRDELRSWWEHDGRLRLQR